MVGKKTSALFLFLTGFGLPLFFAACVTGGVFVPAGGLTAATEPEWVRDPYTKYPRQTNVAAVGSGASREAAEKSALGNLAAIFGQSIQVDETVSTSYREGMENGVTAWSENVGIDTGITTSAGLDSLVGAEIGDVWNGGANGYYAAAVLNKAKASEVYSGMIQSSRDLIERLIDVPPEEKYTLAGLARYQFAAAAADVTMPYVNLLSVIGGPVPEMKRGDDYRLEAFAVAKEIPVGVAVRNDKSGRIKGAFAKALADIGFETGGNNAGGNNSGGDNSSYLLDVNIITTPVQMADNQYKFTRIELEANLRDTKSGTVLLPFNFNSREGHLTQVEADNRAYSAAERKINADYAAFFDSYLSRLLPKE